MPTTKPPSTPQAFRTREQLSQWLERNHAKHTELWVRVFKKQSGTPSVDWEDCVIAALAWGWIDGQRRAFDEESFVQRLTPRRPNSKWSKRNCEIAERLIAEGAMQAAGFAQIEAARQDGRWENAYSGSATMEMPAEFLAAVAESAAAKRRFDALDRRSLYVIYLRLHHVKQARARQRAIAEVIEQLANGATFR